MGEHAAMVADGKELVTLQARIGRLAQVLDAAGDGPGPGRADYNAGRVAGLSLALRIMSGEA